MKHPQILLSSLSLVLVAAPLHAQEVSSSVDKKPVSDGLPPIKPSRPQYASEWDEAKHLGIAPPLTQAELDQLAPEKLETMRTSMKQWRIKQLGYADERAYKSLKPEQQDKLLEFGASLPSLPSSIMPNMEYEKKGKISARARYLLRRSLDETLHLLRIDDMRMLHFYQRNSLPLSDLEKMFSAPSLKWSELFNYSRPQVKRDGSTINSTQAELNIRAQRIKKGLESVMKQYDSITDAQSADAASYALHELIAVYEELLLVFQSGDPALAQYFVDNPKDGDYVINTVKQLHAKRAELRKLKFYDSKKMQFIDQLYY